MINIKYIILEDYQKLENLQTNDEAKLLQGFIAVRSMEYPARTIYINRNKIISIGIDDDQQPGMHDFVFPGRTILGRL